MASKTLRIAVLECDTPLPRALDRYKRYGAITKSFLLASASPSPSSSQSQENGNGNVDKDEKRAELDISIWDVVNKGEFPNLEDDREEALDGVVITGSSMSLFCVFLLFFFFPRCFRFSSLFLSLPFFFASPPKRRTLPRVPSPVDKERNPKKPRPQSKKPSF